MYCCLIIKGLFHVVTLILFSPSVLIETHSPLVKLPEPELKYVLVPNMIIIRPKSNQVDLLIKIHCLEMLTVSHEGHEEDQGSAR